MFTRGGFLTRNTVCVSDVFKIGVSSVLVDQGGDITMKEKDFRWSDVLCELLTQKC